MKTETTPSTVMVVDDTPANLRYLQEIFRHKGYRVVAFPEGAAALNAAARKPPDIILLDILMPEMDGFEVCRRLKADPPLRNIPVLFISALAEGDDKARAFAAGGVDYVTKPFEEREVLSRVETHLQLYRLTRDLEETVEKRTAQLAEKNRALQEEIAVRKQAENQLRTQQAMLQAVFEGIAEPLLLVDRDMRLKLFNKAATSYYQPKGIELVPGKRLCDECGRGRPELGDACDLPGLAAKGERLTMERKGIADPDRTELIHIYPVGEVDGHEGDVIIRVTDITEERRLAREMAQADKLIALGTVVAGVAHEINNPNQVIRTNSGILSDVWGDILPVVDECAETTGDFPIGRISYSQVRQEIPEMISAVESSSWRIQRIVEVLKNYSARSDNIELALFDVNKAVEDALLLLKAKIKQATDHLHVHCGRELPPVNADQQKIEQVLVNLISNAVESLQDKNRAVFITTFHDQQENRVAVEIRDQGVGIPSDIIARITDPFFTTKRATGGTGLGLAIAYGIIKLHNGTLDVRSKEGQGSVFTVTLPCKRSSGEEHRPAPGDIHGEQS